MLKETKKITKAITDKRCGATRTQLALLSDWLTEYNNTVAPIENYELLEQTISDFSNNIQDLHSTLNEQVKKIKTTKD